MKNSVASTTVNGKRHGRSLTWQPWHSSLPHGFHVPQQGHLPVMICLIPNIAVPVFVEVVIRSASRMPVTNRNQQQRP